MADESSAGFFGRSVMRLGIIRDLPVTPARLRALIEAAESRA